MSWLNGLYPGRMVEAVTTFVRVVGQLTKCREGLSTNRVICGLTREPHCLYRTFAVFGKRFGEILLKWLHASILARFYNRKTYM